MRVKYRGHAIEVFRDSNAVADDVLFIYIYRLDDGFEVEYDTYYGSETIREMIQHMKARVDAEIKEGERGRDEKKSS